MSNVVKMIALLVFFGLLILIRAFENELFYDPYLTFFKNDYLYIDNPRREILKLTLFTSLRYFLNTVISLGIIYIFFNDRSVVKFSVLIYVFSFFILLAFFLYFVINPRQEDYYIFFNIRRFLIQPLLLLLLLPAFYYHQLKSKKS
ncbi:exosortase F system-associated membrane protein [Gelidibacter japonicus]|uniref:exosortase F system-associated membrane protein n=1 Tax=Gelidibacter japonicus TaxID=1962232 RepID=UPI0013D0A1C9|nr:exosortase F system-associated protein [Gelidibacter japonicus]MCL8006772.1 exosortase F system-associated protein [Gelidibacter japonicus]